jgi:hypothetical protein
VRRCLLYCTCFFLDCYAADAQTIKTPVTSAFISISTYSTLHANAFSFCGNQAALAGIKNVSAGVYSEKRFLLKELSMYTAAVALPTASGNFGLKADYFGDVSYNEAGLGLAYARKLGDKIDVGIQFNYYSFKTAGYGNASAINAEGGVILHLTDELNIGFHVYNPTSVTIGKAGEEKMPAIYAAGLGYDVSSRLFMGAEIEKIEDQPVNVNAGLQYYFDEKLFATAGIASATSTYYFGFGIAIKNLQLNAVASMHPQLGITPGLMLLFDANNKSTQQ